MVFGQAKEKPRGWLARRWGLRRRVKVGSLKQPAQGSHTTASFVRLPSTSTPPTLQPAPKHPLMAQPTPNAFSNELAQWVGRECMNSIVFVELRPKNHENVKEWWDTIFPIPGEPDKIGSENAARLERCKDYQRCTGFVVSTQGGGLRILTCANVLGFAFKKDHPINAAKVNDLYYPMILCDHREERFQAGEERVYMRGIVEHICCSMDLMLLRVPAAEVNNCCPHPHPALEMADTFPKRLVRVVMLSWPIESHRTAVEGKISHPSRPYKSMSKKNIRGYRMRLSEVDITSEEGSLGAPLLTGLGRYCGVLHGGNLTFSFYTSLADLRRTLTRWGVI